MYIAYTTAWSEGVIVAHNSDRSFPIGSNAVSGSTNSVDTMRKLRALESFEEVATIKDDNIEEACSYDTAFYMRDAKDSEELSKYLRLRNEIK